MTKWTDGRINQFIRSALRAAFRKWPPKFEALKAARVEVRINPKSGRLAMHYKCALCAGEFVATAIQVDHTKPIVGKKGFESWDKFIANLYCSKARLQVLCIECHKKKSQTERKQRNVKSKKTTIPSGS